MTARNLTQGDVVLPSGVSVNGKAVAFDQTPVMVDGMLFMPLRAIAEAAGGTVTWDEALKLIHVRMSERRIMIHLGDPAVEMNQDGVYYLTRNMIQMQKAPPLVAEVGPQVEVTWAGPLLMTYPAQGAAAEIVVHK